MKNVLTKMGYMAIGCLLTIIGYHFGNVENNSVSAQQSSESATNIVDKIRVRQLEIVDDDDTPRVKLDRDGIKVYNAMRVLRAAIGVNQNDSGMVLVLGEGPPTGAAALLDVDEFGGEFHFGTNSLMKQCFKHVSQIKGKDTS